jgi:hypothetical protein
MNFKQVVIWGFPLHTHTHSYIHGGWFKGFKSLGYKTFWFDDTNYPKPNDFDYTETLFITEGYADGQIPLNDSSIYFVHVCIHPEKYLGKVKRLIDIRYLVDGIKDVNYHYVLDKNKCTKISEATYYDTLQNNGGITKHHAKPIPMNYECIYTCWATDLLPEEIKEEYIDLPKEKCIYWCGSYNANNNPELRKFIIEAEKNGIRTLFNNPWQRPLSYEDVKALTMRSFLSPDIRCSGDPHKISQGETGTCHKSIGYIPCRILKAISYGLLGITNSKHVYELLDKKVIYNADEGQLFYDAIKEVNNKDLIKAQMALVRDKHTYINRINDLLKVLNQ